MIVETGWRIRIIYIANHPNKKLCMNTHVAIIKNAAAEINYKTIITQEYFCRKMNFLIFDFCYVCGIV